MTQFLPPNLLALFAARDAIPFAPPVGKLSHEKKRSGFTGIGDYLSEFEDPKDTPPKGKVETRDERRERKGREKAEQMAYKLEQQIAVWNPQEGPAASMDAFKTIFVGRVNYDTSESKLRREFESYGTVKKIVMVFNQKTGKPRGYAFVEYEHERDMQAAYKNADGKKIDGRRVVVDIERGRTVKGWLPRRLGGGLGGTRRGGPEVNVKISGRDHEIDRRGGDSERFKRSARSKDRSRSRNRSRSRSRERRDRPDRSRERGDRDKSRDIRDRGDRGDRVDRIDRDRRRSRDRRDKDKKDKKRKRSRSKSRDKREHKDGSEEGEIKAAKKKKAHEKEKKRHRSKSRDREKDKKKDRKDRDKDKSRNKEDSVRVKDEPDDFYVHIKDEPQDDYPEFDSYNQDGYEGNGNYIKTEPGVDQDGNKYEDQYDDGYAPY